MLAPWKKSYEQSRQWIKKQRHYFANKGPSSQSYGFSSSHVWMWELDYKESWAPKNWCFWTVVLEISESPLDSKETKSVNCKENQLWIFIGRTDAKAEAPIFGCLMQRPMFGKDRDAGKDWRPNEKGWQRMWWLDSIIHSMDMNLCKIQETVEKRGAWSSAIHGVTKSRTWLSNWTRTTQNN